MSNIVLMQQGKALPALPEHLWDLPSDHANDDLKSGVGGSIAPPRLSIKGGVFRVITATEERALVRVDQETGVEIPIPALPVVLVASNKGRYKTFFGEQDANGNWSRASYDDADAQAPVCYSYDGERPSPMAPHPQCASCAACPQNVMGSATTESGKQSKGCSDGKLLAVLPYAVVKKQMSPDDPAATAYQVKVSPTALSRNKEDRKADPNNNTSLSEFIGLLDSYQLPSGARKAIPAQAVVTTLFFDTKVEYPLLRFRIQGFLTPAEHQYVLKRAEGDDVKALVSEMNAPATPAPAASLPPPQQQARIAAPAAPAPAPAPVAPPPAAATPEEAPVRRTRGPNKPKPAAAPAPIPQPTAAVEPDPFEVGSGAAPVTPQTVQTAKPAVPQVPQTSADMDAMLAEVGNLWG